jgi:hypothetical protein
LNDAFELAQAWDCIVLLDESDVFLAERNMTDLKRNALVSVFLRVLEYYTGILFLTTNREGTFDEAFRSRIQVALFYDHLGPKETQAIWENNLNRLHEHAAKIEKDTTLNHAAKLESQVIVTREQRDLIMRFARIHFGWYKRWNRSPWNGRQIRNAFQTAIALASFDAKRERVMTGKPITASLTFKHFRTVAEATDQFETYMRETTGFDPAEKAHDKDLRAGVPRHLRKRPPPAEFTQQAIASIDPLTDPEAQVISPKEERSHGFVAKDAAMYEQGAAAAAGPSRVSVYDQAFHLHERQEIHGQQHRGYPPSASPERGDPYHRGGPSQPSLYGPSVDARAQYDQQMYGGYAERSPRGLDHYGQSRIPVQDASGYAQGLPDPYRRGFAEGT